jgi:phosphoglycerate dehydrogenase-like enzyme
MTHILIAIGGIRESNLRRIENAAAGWATWEYIPEGTAPDAYQQKLADADIVIGWPKAAWLRQGRVSLVIVPSHGFEPYEGHGLEARPGFRLCNSRGAYSVAVAEHCIALMLALARNLHQHVLDQREGRWQPRPPYYEVAGSSACVVGVGSVGSEIARRCASLGMLVTGVDIADVLAPPGLVRLYHASAMLEAVAQADHVIAIVPGGQATLGLFNRDFFAALKPGAFFYNVGRGAAVDEAALVEALQSGHLAGAGLDVFAEEPLPAASPLWQMDNVLITPHIAGNSTNWDNRLTDQIVANLINYRDGLPLNNQVLPRP